MQKFETYEMSTALVNGDSTVQGKCKNYKVKQWLIRNTTHRFICRDYTVYLYACKETFLNGIYPIQPDGSSLIIPGHDRRLNPSSTRPFRFPDHYLY